MQKQILEIFKYQYEHCAIYKNWCDAIAINLAAVRKVEDIPFLPIEFFKTAQIYCSQKEPQIWFESSGTSGAQTSKHFIADVQKYVTSYESGFKKFYGDPSTWSIFGLLPLYMDRPHSSLAMMAEGLHSKNASCGGFFLDDFNNLIAKLELAKANSEAIFLIGVTFALVEFAQNYKISLPTGSIVMETGGMKGRGREIERKELHKLLCDAFGVEKIHSEYGMTELLSQAYSQGDGIFHCSDSMTIVGRDLRNPLQTIKSGEGVGLNVIDFSNVDSCSFIATGDLGKINIDGSFEIWGRIEGEMERGCNMLY